MDTGSHPKQRCYFQLTIFWKRKKKLVNAMESHWVYKPHLRAGPIPNSRWPTQNVLKGNIEDCLSLIALFGPFTPFFHLTDLFLVYYGSWFWDFMVCVCVSPYFLVAFLFVCFLLFGSFLAKKKLSFFICLFIFSRERKIVCSWKDRVLWRIWEKMKGGSQDENIVYENNIIFNKNIFLNK